LNEDTASEGPGPDLGRVLREDQGRLIAALIRSVGSIELAEEALSEALESAVVHWSRSGQPRSPRGWLLQVARRKAIDRIRKSQRARAREADLQRMMEEDQEAANAMPDDIPDDRLRLIFTCCHPALEPKTRVALTLRLLGGLTTAEVARAFLDTDTAMGQRLSRAKAKIAKAGIPYAVPGPEEWDDRLNSVLTVIYLIFNEGYSASSGESPLRVDLCEEAIFLARLVDRLAPDRAEILGLLALLLLTHARRGARVGPMGEAVGLDDQDRQLWDREMIAEGRACLEQAMLLGRTGPFQIQAAISALHTTAASARDTDWRQIAFLYDALWRMQGSDVVRLNRAIALAEAGAIVEAVGEIDLLAQALAGYQPYQAAAAELYCRAGRAEDAERAYAAAIDMAPTDADRAFLIARRAKKEAEH
jgi:RNA polymerase sigma-70 factor (ECF subfamily)